MSASATLWPCGTRSTSTSPEASVVPAGNPPSLATMATLSRSFIRMVSGSFDIVASSWQRSGGAVRFDVQRVQRVAARHVQAVVLRAAEGKVGAALGQANVRQRLALRAEHHHAIEILGPA